MSFFAIDSRWSLDSLVNRLLFPILAVTVVLVTYIPNAVTYYTMRAMIPPEHLDQVRHTTLLIRWIPAAATGLALLACLGVCYIITRHVTRPTIQLAAWAKKCYADGTPEPIRTDSRVAEIHQLVDVFGKLFGDLVTSLNELNVIVHTLRHDLASHLGAVIAAAPTDRVCAQIETIKHILGCTADIALNRCRLGGEPPTELYVSDLVHDCLDAAEPMAAANGVTLSADWDPGDERIVAHARKIASILRNLVENAIKYTPAGGNVLLVVKTDTDGLTVTVTDTGRGIPEVDRPKIFERAFRASNVGATPGTGDGLTLVKSAVDFYHGEITCRDNRPAGTVFIVRLPLKTEGVST